jgi:transketolase
MALAERMLAHRFNTPGHPIIDHYTYVLSGDGCMMEGVTAEAASLAGHLKLAKLIVFYDSNDITIEGSTSITFTEDVRARFRAYGWQTLAGDGHDFSGIAALVEKAKREREKPTLIELKSVIGKGSPNMQGKHKVHGAPLGMEEVVATRKNLGAPEDQAFFVHPEAYRYFQQKEEVGRQRYEQWWQMYASWQQENPKKKEELEAFLDYGKPWYGQVELPSFEVGQKLSTRDISGQVLQAYVDAVPNLVGGAADLGPTVRTELQGYGDLKPDDLDGRTIRFGVREHAMGSLVNGLSLHGGYRAYCSTILIFADYMRPSIRLAALMKLPVIYIFTHDSVFLGGDGPTHQPVEHLTSLRIIPGIVLLRPGDAEEAVAAWEIAMRRTEGPTVLAFSRQPVEVYAKDDKSWRETVCRGAYIVKESRGEPDVVIVATGSEVAMAVRAAQLIDGLKLRIVSMMSRDTFLAQEKTFREKVIPPGVRTITVEAGVRCGWEAIASSQEDIMSIDRFGISGPYEEVAEYLGYTAESLAELIRRPGSKREERGG